MARIRLIAALLMTTAGTPALADEVPADVAAQLQAMRAEIDSLKAEVAELKARPAPQPAADAPSWKGAPQLTDKASGLSFKPKGLVQFDAGFVGTPGPELSGTVGGLNYNNLGWNSRARRLVIGAEGTLPGGFGYNVEFNLAQGTVDYEDIVLTYQRPKSPLKLTIGNFYPLSSLETMTSSRMTSFLERASFTDAFNYNRRLGVALALLDPDKDLYTLTAGVFGQEINNNGFARTGWQASVRGTFAPTLGDAKLHLGANFQHRVAQRDAQNVQYRSRPFTQLTDQRFVDTGPIAADGDDILGLEFGAILKSFHAAAEAQQVWVRGYRPGQAFGANNGAAGGLFYGGDPSFRAAYAEVGYYFTGESRGYKGGRWDRPKVLHPLGGGGWGALQANARLDWVDLRDRVGSGANLAAPNYVNGGRQLGYELSLIWNPIDYVRFQAQYARGGYKGGPRAATVVPGSTEPINLRDFDVDTFALRAQVEF
ncbi:MAG: OprO/OprP family phosphate-selective porin [Allosphingosinicella sp.]